MPRVTNPEQARYNGDEFNHISVVRPVAGRGNLPHTLTAMLSEVKARRSTQREKLRDFGLKFAVFIDCAACWREVSQCRQCAVNWAQLRRMTVVMLNEVPRGAVLNRIQEPEKIARAKKNSAGVTILWSR